ncbi:MAG: MATE family efflux transporter [Actinomycetota bacterium]|nr:MATE family efflux transporter [Actinomycetota bacterium]
MLLSEAHCRPYHTNLQKGAYVPPRWWNDTDREIFRLAVPAFAALVSEPLFLLADAAIVGHLGTPQLAGLGVAGAVLQTLLGVFVFLAYGTTSSVARQLGAGERRRALAQGVDGLWLALALGLAMLVVGVLLGEPIVALFDPDPAVTPHALTYLRISSLGLPAMFLVLAATGVLRGLLDTRTPLVVMIAANLGNVALNLALVYGLGLGIAGSALGTVIAQAGAAAALVAVVLRAAREYDAPLLPDPTGIRAAGRLGVPLVVRTVTLRAALLLTTYVATAQGATSIAAHQVAFTVWTFLAFALDAVAIAAQALTGKTLGAGDAAATRRVTRRMLGWGLASGAVTGLLLLAGRDLLAPLFTPDPAVQALLSAVLVIVALQQPVAGVVFVLDGVLIGAGDGAYLAWAGVLTLVAFTPLALLVLLSGSGLLWLWAALGGFMLARLTTLLWRERGDAWLRTGAAVR